MAPLARRLARVESRASLRSHPAVDGVAAAEQLGEGQIWKIDGMVREVPSSTVLSTGWRLSEDQIQKLQDNSLYLSASTGSQINDDRSAGTSGGYRRFDMRPIRLFDDRQNSRNCRPRTSQSIDVGTARNAAAHVVSCVPHDSVIARRNYAIY